VVKILEYTLLNFRVKNFNNCKIIMLEFKKEVFSTLSKWLKFFQTFYPKCLGPTTCISLRYDAEIAWEYIYKIQKNSYSCLEKIESRKRLSMIKNIKLLRIWL